jgi:hypothetical protein
MLKRFLMAAIVLVLGCCCEFVNAQVAVEPAWQIINNPGAKATYAATDSLGDTYLVEQNSNSTAVMYILSPYQTLLKTYQIQGVVGGLVVDPASGTAAVSVSGSVQAFYWDGNGWRSSTAGTLIGFGMDDSGRVIMLNANPTFTYLSSYAGNSVGTLIKIPVVASGAYVDNMGRFLLTGSTGPISNTTSFANFYGEDGTLLWSRTFNRTFQFGESVAGFAEDGEGTGYLAINQTSINGSSTFLEAIDPNNGANDVWDSAAVAGTTSLVCADSTKAYIAGSNGAMPFIAAYRNNENGQTLGAQAWLINDPAVQMVQNGSGPLVLSYDSTAAKATITNYDAETGALENTTGIAVPTSADLGRIVSTSPASAEYLGDTGGTSPEALIIRYVYGEALSSVVLPTTVVGGSSAQGTVNFDQPIFDVEFPQLFSSSNVVTPPTTVELGMNSTSATFNLATVPVNVNTVATVFARQRFPFVQRSAKITVLTATLSSLTVSPSPVTAPEALTGKVTLSGPAGSLGKTIALSSNSSELVVPPSLKIPANATSATFTIASHAPPKDDTVTITAALGGLTRTFRVVVKAPVLSSFMLKPTSVVGGTSSVGTVALTGPVAAARTVTITSTSPNVTVPATATIAAGASTVSFSIKTKAVSASTTASIKVSFGTATLSQTLTITP